MTGELVVAYDGSGGGHDALALGSWIATSLGATPVVVNVYPKEPLTVLPGIGADWVLELRDKARETVATARPLLREAHPGASYRTIGAGSAAAGLDQIARRLDAEMIVVGSSRRGIHLRVSNNHTANRLYSGASSPVLIAPRGVADRGLPPLTQVGCAFVPTREGRHALRRAAQLAERAGAALEVFTVAAPGAEMPRADPADHVEYDARVREALTHTVEESVSALSIDIEINTHMLDGDPVHALAALGEDCCQLLVCSSRGYGPVRRVLLGGVTERLVRRAAAPVMVVPRSAR